ncbi:TSCPD domain-containing protein [Desulfogranum japonicum]|uniref:TSCPD domain-containing protein n=1 Tax=Desulfogranum japonicum TaxID=231447 RepID=UPI000409116F|nr:hypothetical protein [Desulfogranum japonicum]
MKQQPNKDTCQYCGSGDLHNTHEDNICDSCRHLRSVILQKPDIIKKLWREYQDEPLLINPQLNRIDAEIELPEVLDGKRYRTIDREFNKWYLSVSEIDGRPVEIFASTAFDRDHQLQSRISNLTTITRLISLILRHVMLGEPLTLEKCLKQLQRSSRQQNDLPDMLYGVLNKYSRLLEKEERNTVK